MPREPRRPLTEKQRAALAAGRAKGREMIASGELVYGGPGGGARRVRPGDPVEPEGPRAVVVDQAPDVAPPPASGGSSRRITWPKEQPAPPRAEPEPVATAEPADEPEPEPREGLNPTPEPEPVRTESSGGGFLAGLKDAFS